MPSTVAGMEFQYWRAEGWEISVFVFFEGYFGEGGGGAMVVKLNKIDWIEVL